MDGFDIIVVPIGREAYRAAARAHDRFGKGRHPARLNMGDCFAYACIHAPTALPAVQGRRLCADGCGGGVSRSHRRSGFGVALLGCVGGLILGMTGGPR